MNYTQTFLKALLLYCQQQNVDIDTLASRAGFKTIDLFTADDFSIDHNQLETLWKSSVQLTTNPLLGLHFGSTMQIAALDAVGQIIQTSNTIKDALLQAASLVHLLTDLYSMQLVTHEETFSIAFKKNRKFKHYPNTFNQMGDFLMAFTLHELEGLLLKPFLPIKAHMPTYQKALTSSYHKVLNCPIHKSDTYSLEFDKQHLNTPIITANHNLQQLLLNHVANNNNHYDKQGEFSSAVFNFLTTNSYLFSINIDFVASHFNMSIRSLQRKLKEEGASYNQIVEDVKKSLAIHYIKHGNSTVKEIAHMLGYAETSGFAKAFKKWTGKTPTGFRQNR